ncbi:hypothetical protein ACFE04_027430 [Oxalis oulophora]
MAEEEVKVEETVETVTEQQPPPPPPPAVEDTPSQPATADVAPPTEEKLVEETLALSVVEKAPEVVEEGSVNRDAVLARVETQKMNSLIIAWEENEKSKAENKAHKKLSDIGAWENSKIATIEAELKQLEEKLEKKKAEYVEKMKNKIALVHKDAEEKRAITEAKRGEALLKAEEAAAKYRATGTTPKKGWF